MCYSSASLRQKIIFAHLRLLLFILVLQILDFLGLCVVADGGGVDGATSDADGAARRHHAPHG